MIRALGFLDVSKFTANFLLRYRDKHLIETEYGGLLPLRDADAEGAIVALDVLKEWLSARSLFTKLKNEAAPWLDGQAAILMKACIEVVNPDCATPWTQENDDYAKSIHRLRVCLIPSPNAMTHSGPHVANLGVGLVNLVDHTVQNCETNFGAPCPRTHLIVDVRRLDADE